MAIVVVSYRYSTTSDRVLDQEAVWKGRIPGRSLATLVSELHSRHRGATNMFIMHAEWSNEAEVDA